MRVSSVGDEQQRILRFWWMLELFSPQKVPKVTPRSTRPGDRQVVEWRPGTQLPWEKLAPPKPLGNTRRVWEHTVYLGVYRLDATYERLHRAFGEDTDAYDLRPGGRSACAGLLIDQEGRLISGSAVLSSALWAVARIDNPGPQDPSWADGFTQAHKDLAQAVDDYEGDRRDDSDSDCVPIHDATSIHGLLRIAHLVSGIAGVADLATDLIVIQSTAISARRTEEVADIDGSSQSRV